MTADVPLGDGHTLAVIRRGQTENTRSYELHADGKYRGAHWTLREAKDTAQGMVNQLGVSLALSATA